MREEREHVGVDEWPGGFHDVERERERGASRWSVWKMPRPGVQPDCVPG